MQLQDLYLKFLRNLFFGLTLCIFISSCEKDSRVEKPKVLNRVEIDHEWPLQENDSVRILMEHTANQWTTTLFNQYTRPIATPSLPGIPEFTIYRNASLLGPEAFKVGTYSVGDTNSDFTIFFTYHSDAYSSILQDSDPNYGHGGYLKIHAMDPLNENGEIHYRIKFTSQAYIAHIGPSQLRNIRGIITFKE